MVLFTVRISSISIKFSRLAMANNVVVIIITKCSSFERHIWRVANNDCFAFNFLSLLCETTEKGIGGSFHLHSMLSRFASFTSFTSHRSTQVTILLRLLLTKPFTCWWIFFCAPRDNQNKDNLFYLLVCNCLNVFMILGKKPQQIYRYQPIHSWKAWPTPSRIHLIRENFVH